MAISLTSRWHNLPIRYKCAMVLALPVVCLLFEIAWQSRVLNSLEDAQRWTTHTQEVELTAASLQGLLSQIESSDRGYALSRSDEFLRHLRDQEQQARSAAQHLCDLVQDNPVQLARARSLALVSEEKLRIANEVVAYFSAHPVMRGHASTSPELALRLLVSKQRMDEFMEQSSTFINEEERLLGERVIRLQRERRFSQKLLIFFVAGGLIVGLMALQLFTSTVGQRLSSLQAESQRL